MKIGDFDIPLCGKQREIPISWDGFSFISAGILGNSATSGGATCNGTVERA